MKNVPTVKEPGTLVVALAFIALYIIWGSTYLAIRIAIESIPPFFMLGTRFLVAGTLLFMYLMLRGEKLPSVKAFLTAASGGILMLYIGNGAVTFAEQYLPSGLAAIIVATVPIWFIVLDKKQWKFHFTNKLIIIGILLGFAGVLMLFAGKGTGSIWASKMKIVSFFVLICGTIGWAVGSLLSKYKQVNVSVSMKAALQMIGAGIVGVGTGLLKGEQHNLYISNISWQSITALLYLVVFGSLVAYMSYIWLLSVKPPALVGTYAYVNPIVAVFLGWLVLNETITIQQVLALLVILSGIVLVNFSKELKKILVWQKSIFNKRKLA